MDGSRKIIGVDFGSSQSSVSLLKIGSSDAPKLIEINNGRNGTIPTILLVDANDNTDIIAWGSGVRQYYKQKNNGDYFFADNFKRYLGMAQSQKPKGKEKADLFCKKFIEKLAEAVREYENVDKLTSKDYATCFAYPATWNDDQIALLKRYAKEAGFPADPDPEVEGGIYVIPEPVAAMYSLKVQGAASNFSYGQTPENFMVIDFGGGTLDICVVHTGILGDHPRIVSTSGDPTLGGYDFDKIIEDLFYREFPDVKNDLSAIEEAELRDRFKEAKEIYSANFELSDSAIYTFPISRGDYNLKIDKCHFENICRDKKIFEKIENSIDKALNDADLTYADIKKVILTGGSSKWVFMRKLVAEKFTMGGDDICLTSSPFTDVATGCAVFKGWPNDPPLRPGVWIKIWIDGKPQNDVPKCILEPSKSTQGSIGELTYIGKIEETRYLKPYRIEIAWFTGFSADKLEEAKERAVIQYYARSNWPFSDRIRGAFRGLKGMRNDPLVDEYKIYAKCEDNPATGKKYTFQIYDSEASNYEKAVLSGKEDADKYPKGKMASGVIFPGSISYCSIFGLGGRKNKELH